MAAAVETLLLDVRQVAAALSVSPRTAQNLIYRGRLQSVTVGRLRRVAAVDLTAFVMTLRAENKTASTPSHVEAQCHQEGKVTPATELHHLLAVSRGGSDDPDNLEPLCHRCHAWITANGG